MKKILISLLLIISMLLPSLASCDLLSGGTKPPAGTGCPHEDADGDELCDNCGTATVVVVDIYSINDLHGKFCDTESNVGVDELASYLKAKRAKDDYSVLISAGDTWQGSAESNLTGGAILTEWMNMMEFAAMTLGNHEFDWGEDAIRENDELADFPFLAINVYDNATGKLADYCDPSVMVDLGAIQVGIIGAIGDCYSSISSDKVTGVHFKVGSELTALVKAEAKSLRDAGADLIVYSLHDGRGQSSSGTSTVSSSELADYYQSSLGAFVDVVFEGHTHQSYVLKDGNGTYHLQGGGENSGITHAEIRVDLIRNSKQVTEAEVVRESEYSAYADDTATEELEGKYTDVISKAYSTLGTVSTYFDSYRLADLVAELYLEAGVARWGDEYDIVLGGGYIKPRSPYDLTSGKKCYADILPLLPFDNRLVLCSIRGSDLLSRFVTTSNGDYHNAYSLSYEELITSIDQSATYYVVVDTYTQLYAPNRLTAIEYYDEGVYARDLLANAISEGRLGAGAPDKPDEIEYTSIPEVLEIGASLAGGAITDEKYYVSGIVSGEPNAKYGNLYLTDRQGNTVYVYGLYDTDGNLFENMPVQPKEGDLITVLAPIMNYVNPTNPSANKIELKDAILILIEDPDDLPGDESGGSDTPDIPTDPGLPCPAHTDSDNNGLCDSCGITVVIIVDIYSINDLHGKFCDTESNVGIDELATYLKTERAKDDYSVLISAGDTWQGSAESNLTGGAILTEWMNMMEFAAMTLGNHEFDWGEDAIRDNLAIADFPFLAINVYDNRTGKLADYCTPSVMIDLGDVQIGIIGAIGDCYSSISSDKVTGVHFKVGSELAALVKAEAEQLRAEGADLIIYSLHDGYSSPSSSDTFIQSSALESYYQSVLRDYVDIVFEGHTHRSYVLEDSNGTYHLQGGGENSGITHAEIRLNLVTGEKTVVTARIVRSSVYSSLADDAETENLEDKYDEVITKAYSTLGNVADYMDSDAVADLVAELYIEAGVERWGGKYNIVLGGGYIKTRSPYDLTPGAKCYAHILSLLPFDNPLVLCSIKGSDLISRFINVSGDYHSAFSDWGNTVKGSIDRNATYYVVVDTYTMLYAPNRLTLVEYYDEVTFARDLLAAAIAEGRLAGGTTPDTPDTPSDPAEYELTSIPELLTIGSTLGAGATTAEKYYVRGTVTSTPQSRYGNLYLTDEQGNTIYVYGLYDENGNRYEYMTEKPKEGDVIIIYAPVMYYVNPNNPSDAKIELNAATLVMIVEEEAE